MEKINPPSFTEINKFLSMFYINFERLNSDLSMTDLPQPTAIVMMENELFDIMFLVRL